MHTWIDERKVSMMKHFNYFLNLLQEISKRNNISYGTITLFKINEIEQLLLGKKIDLVKIEKRKKQLFFICKQNNTVWFDGKEALELIKTIPSRVNSKDIIKGIVASKGSGKSKIVGEVRIVHNPSKDIFNSGEILVTTMTRPEFVPIMKKAKAIITDEGGLTSHAAIVSRELNTPAIIGTHIATQLLKNGFLVEVDISSGTVKILEENKKK